ncbi:MAG TPA: DUF4350 domain-containing protein [Novosphingobium sp.]|nr:DUF4350 domain-containing protein [Novosphingobium sp.]
MSAKPAPNAPFAAGSVLALVVLGCALLLAILWMLGTGLGYGDANDGGGHAGGRGLNGFAAMAAVLDKAGYEVGTGRSDTAITTPGLLVLTPPHNAKPGEIGRIAGRHLEHGPVMVILPKWQAWPAPDGQPGMRKGWVQMGDGSPPEWLGWHDEVQIGLGPLPPGQTTAQATSALGASAILRLPQPRQVQSGRAPGMTALVVAGAQDAGGTAPGQAGKAAGQRVLAGELARQHSRYSLILVYEPDLLDNYGMARPEAAILAEALVARALRDVPAADRRVTFDITLNGLGFSPNLLTLAFTPPYLAATLVLVLAGMAAGWRAFCRFGAGTTSGREIAFGKRALIENGAGLVARTRRWHLLGAPYADAVRGRIAAALGLPRHADHALTEAAIDRALAARGGATPFSTAAAALRDARRPAEILRHARALHAIERMLTR